MRRIIIFFIFLSTLALFGVGVQEASSIFSKTVTIEDFDNSPPELLSWRNLDTEPDGWEYTQNFGYNNTSVALHLFGNTAKRMGFYPVTVDSRDVWQSAVYIVNVGDTIGIGFYDNFHVLFYSIAGSSCLNIDDWVTCYQGIYSNDEWHEVNFPVADDWQARYNYLPSIKGIVFINNRGNYGNVYFDEIRNMTTLLPEAPVPDISYEILEVRDNRDGSRSVVVHFESEVIDDDSDSLSYYWQMGDNTVMEEAEFDYTYRITDDHPYSVSLKVTDDTGLEGYASCVIEVNEGSSSLPLTMNFTGDIILAREINNIINGYGYEAIFDSTKSILGDAADITVSNLECPLTDSNTHHPTKTIYFKGQESSAEGLAYAGIDIVTLANNHILDYMEEGITDTQAALNSAGVLYSGAGLNSYEAYRPILYNRKGINLAFLASSDRTGQYNNYQPYLNCGYDKAGFAYLTKYYMQKQINEVRQVSDLVIMELHCGSEYSTGPGSNYDSLPEEWYLEPNPEDDNYSWRNDVPQAWDMEYRHYAVDAGADLVICHHPHIVQGFEVYNGTLIAHSLGNFIFDLSYTETMPTCILYAEAGADGFERFYVKPCYIDDNITVPAEGELGLYILDHLAQKSKELQTYLDIDRDAIQAEIVLDTLSMPQYSHNFIEFNDLEFRDEYYTTGPALLHKVGSISALNTIDQGTNWEFRLGREIVYHGNFEAEGCSEWAINSSHEWLTQEEPYMGDNCLCIELESSAGDNIITNLEGRIKLYDDVDYSLHGYIRTSNTEDAEVQIRTYANRTGGNYINMFGTPPLDGDNPWTYVWADIPELEYNERYIDYRSTVYPPQEDISQGYFDNVGLIGWSDWKPFNGSAVEVDSPNEYYYIEMRTTDEVQTITWTYTEKNYGFIPVLESFTSPGEIAKAVLNNNYPNPFNPETKIAFTLNQPANKAKIDIYNIRGQKVNSLPVEINRGAGNYSVIWQGDNERGVSVGSGVYFYRLAIDGQHISAGKCLLLK
ncbi:MAG: CapA family protein [Candidatus Stygibacter frigidus]|nr:CapA family protein [Candidatus Stygibacter frigidus]